MSTAFFNRLGRTAPGVILALTLGFALPVSALELEFPGAATLTASRSEPQSSIRLPTGPFANGTLPTQLTEGALDMAAFRLMLERGSTLDLMQSLRAQVVAAGFEVVFECETEICGGYDFRYGTEVLPEPDMHVDLGDFRYLLAKGRNVADGSVALLVSSSGKTGFAQVTKVGGRGTVTGSATSPVAAPDTKAVAAEVAPTQVEPMSDLATGLESGRARVLEDLVFPSGSAALAEGDYASLAALAAWLAADSGRKVVLVGHTDVTGGLEGNIRLSRLRAESVRQALLFKHNISPDRVQAEGIGFLSPRESNLTEEGRRKNRRVEVMATSTELLAP